MVAIGVEAGGAGFKACLYQVRPEGPDVHGMQVGRGEGGGGAGGLLEASMVRGENTD